MDACDPRRSASRRPFNILVKGRVRSRPVWVDIVDLSETGCKLHGGHGFAHEGETVSLMIDGIKSPLGKVVWVNDREAGVAFEGQLHPAVLDHLEARNRERQQQRLKR